MSPLAEASSGRSTAPGPTASSSDHGSAHRLSTELPPLPIIPRANPARNASVRRPLPAGSQQNSNSSILSSAPMQPGSSTQSTSPPNQPTSVPPPTASSIGSAAPQGSVAFAPVTRSASRLSTRSALTFIDAPGTITVLPEITRQDTRASRLSVGGTTKAGADIEKGMESGSEPESPVTKEDQESHEGSDGVDAAAFTFPDGGKEAWLVVLGGVCALFCGFGLTAALGGFQTYYSFELIPQYDSSTIAWIPGTQAFITFGLAAFTGSLFDKYGHRPLMLTGTILSGLGLICLSFCHDYWQLFIVHAIPIGIGNNLIFISPMGVVGQWFSRRRGLAFGILTSGASLGSVGWPLVIASLPQRVGFPWTVRIMGFVTLFLGFAALFLLRTRLPPKPPGPFFYLVAFRKLPYCCIAASSFTYVLAFFAFLTFIGHIGVLTGLGDYAPYLLIITNGASAFGRISLGIAADYVGPYNITTFATLIMAVLYWAWTTLRTAQSLTAFAVVFGYWSGAYVSLQAPMAASQAEDMRYAGTMVGMVLFFMSFAQLSGGPIFGALLGRGSEAEQLANAPKAIAFGASMMTLTTILLAIGRLGRSRKLIAKV